MADNLPPGVSSTDIPGNRPVDRAYDQFIQDKEKMSEIYQNHFGEEPETWDEILEKLEDDHKFKKRVQDRFKQEWDQRGSQEE